MSDNAAYPQWPPGFWRRIVIWPQADWIGGALEDDVHSFRLRFDHDGTRITHVEAGVPRHPWTACPGAGPHIASELTGELLADVARRDPTQHCTHLFDLAILLAAHVGDTAPTRYDGKVADRVGDRFSALLERDGREVLRWELAGTAVGGDGPHAGRDLKQLSQWKRQLSPEEAEYATVLRRAVFVSGVRSHQFPTGVRASDQGPTRMGVCYNYQLPQAAESYRAQGTLPDFSAGEGEPLGGFDPQTAWGGS